MRHAGGHGTARTGRVRTAPRRRRARPLPRRLRPAAVRRPRAAARHPRQEASHPRLGLGRRGGTRRGHGRRRGRSRRRCRHVRRQRPDDGPRERRERRPRPHARLPRGACRDLRLPAPRLRCLARDALARRLRRERRDARRLHVAQARRGERRERGRRGGPGHRVHEGARGARGGALAGYVLAHCLLAQLRDKLAAARASLGHHVLHCAPTQQRLRVGGGA